MKLCGEIGSLAHKVPDLLGGFLHIFLQGGKGYPDLRLIELGLWLFTARAAPVVGEVLKGDSTVF